MCREVGGRRTGVGGSRICLGGPTGFGIGGGGGPTGFGIGGGGWLLFLAYLLDQLSSYAGGCTRCGDRIRCRGAAQGVEGLRFFKGASADVRVIFLAGECARHQVDIVVIGLSLGQSPQLVVFGFWDEAVLLGVGVEGTEFLCDRNDSGRVRQSNFVPDIPDIVGA